MLLRTSDAELFYKTEGKGPDVVLLHPFPSCHEFWTPIKDKLAAKYRLIMPDLRGLGESQAGEGNVTIQKHAEDLAKLSDELKVGKAVFIGCSVGGYILFEFWRRFRERVAVWCWQIPKLRPTTPKPVPPVYRRRNKYCSKARSSSSTACCQSCSAKLPVGIDRTSWRKQSTP